MATGGAEGAAAPIGIFGLLGKFPKGPAAGAGTFTDCVMGGNVYGGFKGATC